MSITNNFNSSKSVYDHLFGIISGDRFLSMQSIGNEVPFYICPFLPEDANEMNKIQRQLSNRLNNQGVTVLTINLYDLSIGILKEIDVWDRLLEIEQTVEKDQLKELLQGVLDPETHLVPAIAKKLDESAGFDVLFLTGVGEVFPYIRSHNVLNNLQSTAKERPTVIFFPGAYTHSIESGASLDLFDRLHDDKYYRAFNIFYCEA